jgi:hypothetical protein
VWGGDGGVGGVSERFGVFGGAGLRIRVLRVMWLVLFEIVLVFL